MEQLDKTMDCGIGSVKVKIKKPEVVPEENQRKRKRKGNILFKLSSLRHC